MDKCVLIKPELSFESDILAFRKEMLDADSSMDGTGPLKRMNNIKEWLEFNQKCENEQTVPENWVTCEQYIYVRETDNKIVGMIQFRHYFNEFLEKYGGHIGYSVRPDERRKGYAKRMLADCLNICRLYGLDKVLVTCIEGNEGSKRTILANGGIYESTIYCGPDDVTLERYWIHLLKNRSIMKSEIEKNWDEMSKAYEDFTEDEDSYSYTIEWSCIKKMLPSLHEKKILDLGCGTGRFDFLFEKENPFSITGIDISENMLNIAKEKAAGRDSKVEFIKGDISNFNTYIDRKFDFIFSSTTFHYISDLGGLFNNIYNALNKKGVCIVSMMHPVYTAQYPIDKNGEFPSNGEWTVRYLDKSKRAYIQPWIEYNDGIRDYLSTSYHHTFGDYFNAIIGAGLKIERVEEPYPPENWKLDNYERYNAFIETPSYLIIRLSK